MVATHHAATGRLKTGGGERADRGDHRSLSRPVFMRPLGGAIGALVVGLLIPSAPVLAAKARISGLSDVAFGTVANLGVDAVRSESVCVYSMSGTNGYNVTANGDGPAGSFQLVSGTSSMPFEVQWSNSPSGTSGKQLNANVPLTGQVTAATQQTCNSGPASSASLIVVLRSSALSSATAGTYNGTLTLVVGPE